MLRLKRVETRADWREFQGATRDLLDVNRHPFYRHAFMYPVLAYNEKGLCVGRIVGLIDEDHNRLYREATATFGFFECAPGSDDVKVARALIDEVAQWAASRGMNRLRGPMSPSANYEWGASQRTAQLIEACGFSKVQELFEYELDASSFELPVRLLAQAERLKQRPHVRLRSIRPRAFAEDVAILHRLYQDAFSRSWGFAPLSLDEFLKRFEDLRPILDPELVLIAEVRGVPAGFAFCVPDRRPAPWKWLKRAHRVRELTVGVSREFLPYALGSLFYSELENRIRERGYSVAETRRVVGTNRGMIRALERMSARSSQVYHLYDRAIGS